MITTNDLKKELDVSSTGKEDVFFVKIDKKEMGYCKTEEGAKQAILKIVEAKKQEIYKKYGGESYVDVEISTDVKQMDSEKGEGKVEMSIRKKGYFYNSELTLEHVIEYKRVLKLYINAPPVVAVSAPPLAIGFSETASRSEAVSAPEEEGKILQKVMILGELY